MSRASAILNVPILTYHDINRKFRVGITRVSPSAFRRQMEWMSDSGYRSVRLSEISGSAVGSQKLFAITLDDAYCDLQTTALPILQQLAFKGTLGVISGYVGRTNDWEARLGGPRLRHLDWQKLKEWVDDGHEVASHGYSHRSLLNLTPEQLDHEIRDSKSEIEHRLGIGVQGFVPPFGRIDDRIAEAVANSGYHYVCLDTPILLTVSDLTALLRHSINRFDTMASFRSKVLLGWNSRANRLGWELQHALSGGTIQARRWFLKENIP